MLETGMAFFTKVRLLRLLKRALSNEISNGLFLDVNFILEAVAYDFGPSRIRAAISPSVKG